MFAFLVEFASTGVETALILIEIASTGVETALLLIETRRNMSCA